MGELTGDSITPNPGRPAHRPASRPRMACICSTSAWTSAISARISALSCLIERGPACRDLPLSAALALPSGVSGPVECSQGWFARAA